LFAVVIDHYPHEPAEVREPLSSGDSSPACHSSVVGEHSLTRRAIQLPTAPSRKSLTPQTVNRRRQALDNADVAGNLRAAITGGAGFIGSPLVERAIEFTWSTTS
jgi:hypothetical protein